MNAYLFSVLAALYLGVLTSISPCPLATNIAAVSYLSRRVDSPRSVLTYGLLYTLGRCLLYLSLAALITTFALAIPAVSIFLQTYVQKILGPIFLLLGMFLLGMITSTGGGSIMSEKMQKRIDASGAWGAFLLGILFAVSFCPTSAAWFFGLVALIMGFDSGSIGIVLEKVGLALPETSVPGATIVLPVVYGIGTALPVSLVAILLVVSAKSVGKTYNILAKVEWWARNLTGWLFLILGLYFSLKYVFGVSL
jgi:cytochrome c-type biogenesis protein